MPRAAVIKQQNKHRADEMLRRDDMRFKRVRMSVELIQEITKVVKFIGERNGATEAEVIAKFGFSQLKARFLIEEAQNMSYLEPTYVISDSDGPEVFHISHEGRRVLVMQGLC